MLLWNYVLWTHKDQYLGSNYISCSDAANYFADCYRYLGYFFLAVLAVGLIGLGCSRIRPKEDLKEMHFETSNLNENNNRGAVSQYGRRPPTNEKPDPLSAPGEKNRR